MALDESWFFRVKKWVCRTALSEAETGFVLGDPGIVLIFHEFSVKEQSFRDDWAFGWAMKDRLPDFRGSRG